LTIELRIGAPFTFALGAFKPIFFWFRYELVCRVPAGQGKLEKSRNLSGQGKVRGNEKLVAPDIRFSC